MADSAPTSEAPLTYVKELKDGTKQHRQVTSRQGLVRAEFEGFVPQTSGKSGGSARSSASPSSSS